MNWTDYEESVYLECQRIFGEQVEKDIRIVGQWSGKKRQIDVYVPKVQFDGIAGSMIVDAKYHSRKVDVKDVDSMIGMLSDVNAKYGLLVSPKGFSEAAINRAHNSPDGLQVDILSVDELQILQSPVAIIYSGSHGFFIQSPFGWIIDGTRREGTLAYLYRRGIKKLASVAKEREFMYINMYTKDQFIASVDDLLEFHNATSLSEIDPVYIKVIHDEELILRYVTAPSYPTVEITGFREFDDCILFCVLFCPDIMIKRDIEKLKFILRYAIPMGINVCDADDPS